jgi:hypothetical protein
MAAAEPGAEHAAMIFAVIHGRWSRGARRAEIMLSLVICALMAWTAFGGQVLVADSSDRFLKAMLILITALSLDIGRKLRQITRVAHLTSGMPRMTTLTQHEDAAPARHAVSTKQKTWTKVGAPGGIRTHDPCLRRAVLYPAELRAHV